jgi:predicted metal-dependent enzyme (double-stranded beta helix superfamily)
MFDQERFVDDARRANPEGQGAIVDLLTRTVSEAAAVLQGLGEPQEAGVQTLHRSDNLTILNIIWAPHMVLLPHNHNMWAAIGIYTGREDNILWERHGARVKAVRAASLSEKDTFPLGKDGIHSVVNPSSRLTGAIHIYGGDFFAPGRSEWDADSLQERPFDIEGLQEKFRVANERFKAAPKAPDGGR